MKLEKRLASVPLMLLLSAAAFLGTNAYGSSYHEWADTFNLEECNLSATGASDYFILRPGHQLVLQGEEDGALIELVVTVLDDTKTVDGVETRVVEERETEDGELIEVSLNYFAICTQTRDAYYFGEDVDNYEDGVLVDHEGAWLAGQDDARAGLFVPADPEVGMKYYQEVAPGIAEDRAEVISIDKELETPAGTFRNVLETEETTPLEPGVSESKFYASGIGLIQDADLKLVRYTAADEEDEQDHPTGKPEQRRKAIVARESGREIHERHLQANPRSIGPYEPGLDYTLEALGIATDEMQESADIVLSIETAVWKSNGAIVIMDIVGGTVTLGEEEYDIKLGYTLYSLKHSVIRSAALVESDDGNVFTLKLRGTMAAGSELPAFEGAVSGLEFEGNAHQMNSLDDLNLMLQGTMKRVG